MRNIKYWLLGCITMAVTKGFSQNASFTKPKQGSIVIKGQIGKLNTPKQLWIYIGMDKWDTIPVKDGKFEYRKSALLPAHGAMMVRYKPFVGGNFKKGMDLQTVRFEEGEMYINSKTDSISKAIFSGPASHKQNQYLAKRKKEIEQERLMKSKVTHVIPFTGEMPDGSTFNSESLKGKVFLIDFWGSWCGWCRKGHPHLMELYSKYKDRGFEIIGIGQEWGIKEDQSRTKQWELFKKAIADDGITWPQILNDPAKRDLTVEYVVSGYPTKLLVDREGNIILRVDSDEERRLDAKLEELFRNSN